MRRAHAIMVQGTMSGVGKSLLTCALCRIFARRGLAVAPFKSQNMALNSHVTVDGLEMGRAQAVQAQAAGKEPDVRMNPILLKPSSDTGSQVIVNGEVRGQMTASAYFRSKRTLIPDILAAYEGLARENDLIVIEGAGSPAEINLRADDIVNMGLAELVDAPVVLVGDIDRGGVFAQLYGTVDLLAPAERERIAGLVINKFRGDVALLADGLVQIERLTGKPVLGVVPCIDIDIDDEDSLAPSLSRRHPSAPIDIAVLRLPRISNFTDFAPLEAHPLVGVRYVAGVAELGRPDMIVAPGTKSTLADLRWLRACGLEAAVLRLAGDGVPVLGICGGYQMLGERLDDPLGVEGGGSMRGMGLLPVRTVFGGDKCRARVSADVVASPFASAHLDGYEIHMGRTEVAGAPFLRRSDGSPEGCVSGLVAGTYLHGLFDTGELVDTLVAWLAETKGIDVTRTAPLESHAVRQERQFDILADCVEKSLDIERLARIAGI